MTVFRPSCRVRVQLRIDELAETAAVRRMLEREPSVSSFSLSGSTVAPKAGLRANLAKRLQFASAAAQVLQAADARDQSALDQERLAYQRKLVASTEAQSKPAGLIENPNDERNVLFEILPEGAKVSRNGLQDADTAEVTLDFRDIPIDPRVIRSALVSIAIGTVSADDWALGVEQQRVRDTDGSLLSLVERSPGEELQFNSPSTFVGFVDEWLVEYTEDGDVVKLQCRDVSALLRDERLPAGGGVDMHLPIDQGVQELVDRFPASRGLRVVFGAPKDPLDPLREVVATIPPPVPDDSLPDLYKPKVGTKGRRKKRTEKDESVWDHICKITLQTGLVPVLRGFTLFLSEPRVIFSQLAAARRMVWGRNLKRLSFARKLAGRRNDTIEVRCPDPSIGRTLWARYPVVGDEPRSGVLGLAGSPQPVVTRANNVTPNGLGTETVRIMTVRSVTDLKALERIAESVFEQEARQEVEGSFETDEISSFDDDGSGDLLSLQAGEPITIEVAPPAELAVPEATDGGTSRAVTGSSLQELQAQSAAQRQQYLEGLGMSPQTSRRLAAAQEQVALLTTFRAGNVNLTWSADEGIAIDADFHNFIVVRDGGGAVTAPASESLTQSVRTLGAR
jgi:hypothetical protein